MIYEAVSIATGEVMLAFSAGTEDRAKRRLAIELREVGLDPKSVELRPAPNPEQYSPRLGVAYLPHMRVRLTGGADA